MIHLGRLSATGVGVIAGGLLIGTMLSGFVQPVPLEPPAPTWERKWEPAVAVREAPVERVAYYGSWPQDLSPPPARYTDDEAYAWPDYAWEEPETEFAPAAAPAPVAYGALADRDMAIPHYRALELSASPAAAEAAEIVDDDTPVDPATDPALLVVPIDPTQPPPLPEGRAKTIRVAEES